MVKKSYFLLLFLIGTLITSCVKDLDFDQAENIELTPVFKVPFIKFNLPQLSIPNTGSVQEITETVGFDALRVSSIKDRLYRFDASATIDNSTDRELVISIKFLDSSKTPIYEFQPVSVEANMLNVHFKETVDVNINPNIFETYFVEIKMSVFPNPSSTGIVNPSKSVSFNSSATLHLRIN